MTKSLRRQEMNTGRGGSSGATEHWQRWRGRDMAWQNVLGTSSGDRKSSITDSRVRRTGSDDVDADLIPRSAGWKSSSTRYVGAVPM